MFVFLFIALEEISWGRRIIYDGPSSGIFQNNLQREINFHNFINPLLRILYPITGILFFMVLIVGWIPGRKDRDFVFQYIFPHQNLMFLSIFLMLSSLDRFNDLFEQLASIFAFLYSIRIMMISKSRFK